MGSPELGNLQVISGLLFVEHPWALPFFGPLSSPNSLLPSLITLSPPSLWSMTWDDDKGETKGISAAEWWWCLFLHSSCYAAMFSSQPLPWLPSPCERLTLGNCFFFFLFPFFFSFCTKAWKSHSDERQMANICFLLNASSVNGCYFTESIK